MKFDKNKFKTHSDLKNNKLNNLIVGIFSTCIVATPVIAQAADDFQGNLTSVSITDADGTNQPPEAQFSFSSKGNTVYFDAGDSTDQDGTITQYQWDFGDGYTATGAQAEHTYNELSSFATTLFITDNSGAITIKQEQISLVISTAVKDEFNNDGPLNSNWSKYGPATPVVQSGVVRSDTAKTTTYGYYTGSAFSDDQFAQVTLSDGGANYAGVVCRMDSSGNGYAAVCPGTTCKLYKIINGERLTLQGSDTVSVTVTDSTLKISCEGNTITGYINDIAFDTRIDSTYATGSPGITVYNNWTKGVDNFEAGNL